MTRSLLVLLAVMPGLMLVVSLANAGRNAEWGASELQLQNVDLQPQPVTTTFHSAFGAPALNITDLLAGGRSRFYSPTLPTGFTGTVSVDSPGQVLGVVTHLGDAGDDPPGAAQWPLIDDADLDKVAYVPRFMFQAGGPSSRLSIHNLGSANADVDMTFRDLQGQLYPRRINVPALGTQFLDGAALSPLLGFKGSAVISSNGPIYVGIDRIDKFRSAFSAAHAPAHGGFEIAAPLFVQNSVNTSTLVVQNTNPTMRATGVLSYYDTSGKLLAAQAFTIEPFATFEWSGTAGSAQSFTSGHVVATADQPIVGLVLGDSTQTSGMWDYTAVVAVPDKQDMLDRRAAYGPAAFYGFRGWISQVFIANLSSSPAFVDVTYSSALTDITSLTKLVIPPHGLTVTNLLSTSNDFEHHSVSILSDQPIAATIGAFGVNEPVDNYMAYEAQYAATVMTHPPARRVYLPLIMK